MQTSTPFMLKRKTNTGCGFFPPQIGVFCACADFFTSKDYFSASNVFPAVYFFFRSQNLSFLPLQKNFFMPPKTVFLLFHASQSCFATVAFSLPPQNGFFSAPKGTEEKRRKRRERRRCKGLFSCLEKITINQKQTQNKNKQRNKPQNPIIFPVAQLTVDGLYNKRRLQSPFAMWR